MIIVFIFCVLQGQPTMWVKQTLQSSTMIYTIHGFTAGVFTPPSGEQGRLRRTNNQDEHTLAGSQFCLVAFGSFVQSFKGPSKKLKPVKPSAALQGRHITMPHLALCYKRKSSSTCGSNRSNGRRPHHGNTTPHARNSIHGGHHSDHDSNSRRHPGDRSLQPLM